MTYSGSKDRKLQEPRFHIFPHISKSLGVLGFCKPCRMSGAV